MSPNAANETPAEANAGAPNAAEANAVRENTGAPNAVAVGGGEAASPVVNLWASWRSRYVRGLSDDSGPSSTTDDGTLFERILAAKVPASQSWIVDRGELVSVMLNAYPYCPGHLLVLPNRAVPRLAELEPAESAELWATIQQAVAVVETVYQPGGVNVGLNQGRAAGAGIPDHLHFHVMPRWAGDTNFATTVAGVRVVSESLDDCWERMVQAWQSARLDQ